MTAQWQAIVCALLTGHPIGHLAFYAAPEVLR